jgi:protease YdgD
MNWIKGQSRSLWEHSVPGRHYERLLRTALIAPLILAAMIGAVIGGPFDVDMNIYPWSSIGKVGIASVTVRYACSGAVIGSNEFLTAAHCLYNEKTRIFFPAESVHFLLGYAGGEYRDHKVASRYTIPSFDPSLYSHPPNREKFLIGARNDWAIVFVDESFSTDVKPLRLATATPPAGTAVRIAGYPIERSYMITADLHCQVLQISSDKKLITHDCMTHQGDSGGPLLSKDDEGLILGVNVLIPNLMPVDFRDQRKKWGVAVSAASISDFLASHAN